MITNTVWGDPKEEFHWPELIYEELPWWECCRERRTLGWRMCIHSFPHMFVGHIPIPVLQLYEVVWIPKNTTWGKYRVMVVEMAGVIVRNWPQGPGEPLRPCWSYTFRTPWRSLSEKAIKKDYERYLRHGLEPSER